MSEPSPSEPSPPRRPLPTGIAILLVVIGVVLLLPGLCALFFISQASRNDYGFITLWLICFAISAGGVALIVRALRR
jgi:hypothetical protein